MGLLLTAISKYRKELGNALYGGFGLLSFYFLVMRIASGSWEDTLGQFEQIWPWILLLSTGFSIQVGQYTRLKKIHSSANNAVTKTSAATSGAAMVACCAHHVVDVLPIIGLSGVAIFLTEYQIVFLLVGFIVNLFGIVYMYYQLKQANQMAAMPMTNTPELY